MCNVLRSVLSVVIGASLSTACGADSSDGARTTSSAVVTTIGSAETTTTTTTTTGASRSAPTSTTVGTAVPSSGAGSDEEGGPHGGGCSADELSAQASPGPDVPDAVLQTRQAIVDAAVACDYGALAELAAAGDDPFTYSFGDGGDPAAHWRRLEVEETEQPPLRYLVELLRAPHGQREVEGQTVYAWPSAFLYEDWAEVPQADKDALSSLYGEEDFTFFERFGGYVGYRVGIAEDGEWLYFVAGD